MNNDYFNEVIVEQPFEKVETEEFKTELIYYRFFHKFDLDVLEEYKNNKNTNWNELIFNIRNYYIVKKSLIPRIIVAIKKRVSLYETPETLLEHFERNYTSNKNNLYKFLSEKMPLTDELINETVKLYYSRKFFLNCSI